MSRASNTANLGATLQNTTGNELSGGGNIRAVTFQGSARLLTDLLQLTGGTITIPVGSTRTYKNLQSALNSLTAYIFEDTADVQILLDDETFNETAPINLSHDYGDRITIRGQGDYNFKSIVGNPIVSVSGVNTATLSATIALSPTSDMPAVGDYVNIFSVSARSAGLYNLQQDVVLTPGKNEMSGYLTNNPVPSEYPTTDTINILLTDNCKTLITTLCAYSEMSSVVRTISGIRSTGSTSVVGRDWYSFIENTPAFENFTNSAAYNTIVFAGNPESYRATTFTQIAGGTIAEEATLTFADGAPTNTWLNEGDAIFALGQVSIVRSVSSNNKCILAGPFISWNPTTSARDTTITRATPFLVKTMAERYRGIHRVVAVDNVNKYATLEIYDYGFASNPMAPSTTSYSHRPVSGFPLPKFGISSIGNEIRLKRNNKYVGGGNTAVYYPQAKILKTKLDFSNISSSRFASTSAGMFAMYLNNAKLYRFDNLVCVYNKPTVLSYGLAVGIGYPDDTPTPSSINLGLSGIGFSGFFGDAVYTVGSTIVGNNVGVTFTLPNYASIPDVQRNATMPIRRAYVTCNPTSTSTFNYLAIISYVAAAALDSCTYLNMSNCWVFAIAKSDSSRAGVVNNAFLHSNHAGHTQSNVQHSVNYGSIFNINKSAGGFYGLQIYGPTQIHNIYYCTLYHGYGILHNINCLYAYCLYQFYGYLYPAGGGSNNFSRNCLVGPSVYLAFAGHTMTFLPNGGDGGFSKTYLFNRFVDVNGTAAGSNNTVGGQSNIFFNCNYIMDVASVGRDDTQQNNYLFGQMSYANINSIGTSAINSVTGLNVRNGTTFIPPTNLTGAFL